jgi:hypothetical protein
MSERPRSGDFADARFGVLEDAADRARLAPSVHNTQPWTLELTAGRLALRADRSRQLTVLDPLGRELVLSVGTALLNARAALAAHGWATEVRRLPRPDDPDLLAEVLPVTGRPDSDLAALDRLIRRRHTNRRSFDREPLPRDLVDRLSSVAAGEETTLVELAGEEDRRGVARLTREADRLQNADSAYRAELRRWTTRPAAAGDGVPAGVVPRIEGADPDELPIRDFDTTGAAALPPDTTGAGRNVLLVTTAEDTPYAWLRAGEATERLLLELTRHDWVASPVTQALEVPITREELRTGPADGRHPQMLMRVGRAAPTIAVPRRRREDVVRGSRRRPEVPHGSVPPPPAGPPEEHTGHRPVSDGRGGTIWI